MNIQELELEDSEEFQVQCRENNMKKMNLYLTSEIRDCIDLFGSPMALKTY